MKDIIEKFVLKNAKDYGGKANPGAVLGKVLGEHPELKKDMKLVAVEISKIIKEVAKLSVEEQIKKLEKIAPDLLRKKSSNRTQTHSTQRSQGKSHRTIRPQPKRSTPPWSRLRVEP